MRDRKSEVVWMMGRLTPICCTWISSNARLRVGAYLACNVVDDTPCSN